MLEPAPSTGSTGNAWRASALAKAPQTKRSYLVPVFIATLLVMVGATYLLALSLKSRWLESEAVRIGNIVSRQALATRTAYTEFVADKVERDGGAAGVSDQFHAKPGFVPVPAQFVKLAGLASNRASDGLYRFRPISKWNLEPSQGLDDDFLRWGWTALAAQDRVAPAQAIAWQPVWRIEEIDGKRTLRYLRADPASNASCIQCHNQFERRAEIQAVRLKQANDVGKSWTLHQLMGAVEVQVPMAQLDAAAQIELEHVMLWLGGISLASLVLLAWLTRRDLQQRAIVATYFEHMAKYDPLTALPNRPLFYERAEEALKESVRSGELMAVIFLDLDNFKNINDTLGHEAGDLVLREVASRMSGALRQVDTIARHSGDEFTVLIKSARDTHSIALIARKIAEALRPPLLASGHELSIKASQGISVYPQDGQDVDTLLKNADAAMYQAKARGRNSYQFYSAQMNTQAAETLRLSADLQRAFERNEFELHFQPRLELDTGQIRCAEALIRWRHPTLGLLFPNRFISIAEDAGMVGTMGDWVLATVCAQIAIWQTRGLPPVRVAINLSMRQFRRSKIVDNILSAAKRAGIEPQWLEFEVTESVVMEHPEATAQSLAEMRGHGIAIAVDDFGTGYSSLAYLKKFPLDALKIDKAFIDGLPEDTQNAAITRAVIAMSRSLGLRVIAEGVETPAQRAFLEAEGCDEIQGYLISVPLPAPQFEKLLREF